MCRKKIQLEMETNFHETSDCCHTRFFYFFLLFTVSRAIKCYSVYKTEIQSTITLPAEVKASPKNSQGNLAALAVVVVAAFCFCVLGDSHFLLYETIK